MGLCSRAMPPQQQAFVAFALISIEDGSLVPDDIGSALEEALAPGKTVVRYNRLWRLSQHTTDGDWISGRIGFENPASSVGVWNEQSKDFLPIRPAQVTRYVIDTNSGRVAFELKSSTIKAWTFQGNFQALLNQGSGYRWSVSLEGVSQPSWEEWERSVSRITELRIKMVRPNPRYPGKEVEDMFESAKLAAATIVAQGDNIELTESELLKESFEHAKRGYGSITAKGIAGDDGKKEEWRSEAEGEAERATAERDPATQEVPSDAIRKLVEERNQTNPVSLE